ncbi:MAG: AraC family transcriptional regulator [Pseudomonadota bacterium]
MDRLWAPLVEVQRLNSEPMLASPRANVWQSGPFFFFQYACGGQILRRTIEHVERLNGYVLISRHVTGRIVGTTRDTPFSHRTGIIAIRNLDHPFTAIQYPSAVESILVPHDALKLEADEIPPLCVLLDEAAPIGKLHVALDSLFGALNHVPRTLNNVMLRGLLDLARIAIVQPQYASSRRRAARYGQYVSIQSYIEQNLHRLDLCAETLLPKFGVSRATLYRLFEEEGGVRNYIVDRRLFRALLDISSGPQRRGKIQQAAKSWGFSSAANFNRSVRHAFGGAPGSLFRPTAVLQADTDVIGAHPSRNILVPFSR